MKLTILFILLFALQLPATITLHGQVSLDIHNKELRYVLKDIEDQSTYRFFYNESFADLNKKINAQIDNMSIGETLDVLLTMSDMSYKVLENNLIVIVPKTELQQQRVEISGRVTDASSGQTLPGVTVTVKGTTIGTATDVNGTYSLLVPTDATTLVFSFIGMETVEVSITESRMYNVIMNPTIAGLDEFVVTALGISRERKTLGYAVQDLSSDDLVLAKDNNIYNTLSGKIAGIQVTSGGGSIGASSRIIIRGNASFAGNQPLIVVDGTPLDNRTTNLGGGGGRDWGNVIADIDPSNIESLTVLKGANASALYGSRATNGVILITTKRGDTSKALGVEFTSSFVFDRPAYFPDRQNEYGQGRDGSEFMYNRFLANNPGSTLSYNEYAKQYSFNWVNGMGGGVNDSHSHSWGPRLDAGLLLDQFETGPNSPWISRPNNHKMDYFETGINTENNVTISASGDKAFGRLSYTNLNTTGIIPYSDQRQNTINASMTLNPSDKITATGNITYLQLSNDNIPNMGYSGVGVDFTWSGRQRDVALERQNFENSNMGNPPGRGGTNANNMFYILQNTASRSRERMFGTGSVEYKINDWSSLVARAGLDLYNEYRKNITQSGMHNLVRQGIGGVFSKNQFFVKNLNSDLLFLFDNSFGDIRFDGVLGANYRNDKYETMSLSASDLTVPDLYTISNVRGTPGVGMFESERGSHSLYGAANFSFRDFIFFGITGRNDWSSTLPSANRSYFYPSASLGINIVEAFSLKSDILSYAQVRASLAKVGGDTGPYQLNRTYGAIAFDGISVFTPSSTLPPINLQPEETISWEIGTDLRLWNNRLYTDITYYKQTTQNQILSVPTARSTGYTAMTFNAGEIENSGIEIMLRGNIIDKGREGFRWNANVNYAKNKSMVNKLYGDLESYVISSGFGGVNSLGIPGQPWGVLWGLPNLRDENGRDIVDNRGLPRNTNVSINLGSVVPDWTGGFRNTFRYKNLNLSFLLDATWGGKYLSITMKQSWATGNLTNTTKNNIRETGFIYDGVKADGTENDIRISAQDYYGGSWLWNNHSDFIIDGTFIKLRDLIIGYDFRAERMPWIQSLNVSLVGRNLAVLYQDESTRILGIDPEIGIGGGESGVGFENHALPTYRSFGLRMTVSF